MKNKKTILTIILSGSLLTTYGLLDKDGKEYIKAIAKDISNISISDTDINDMDLRDAWINHQSKFINEDKIPLTYTEYKNFIQHYEKAKKERLMIKDKENNDIKKDVVKTKRKNKMGR